MTLLLRRTLLLICGLLCGTAGAQGLPPALVSQMKALGLSDPQGPDASGGYTMGSAYLHNKTSGNNWVAVLPAAGKLGRLSGGLGGLKAKLTDPVLIVALTDGTSAVPVPAAIQSVLTATVKGNQPLAWKQGINLLARLDAESAGPLKSLQDNGLYPNGGALLTGTLGAAVLSGDVNGDWSVTLDAALGKWTPKDSPLSAHSATFTVRQDRTGVSGTANSMKFGVDLAGATLNWPGFTSPSLDLKLALLVRSQTDYELSGSLAGFKVGPRAFTVRSTEFFYANSGVMTGVGLRVRFNTAMDKNSTQSWTAQVKGSTAGALSFMGTLDNDWSNPFGMQAFALLKGTSIDFSFAADADIGLGLTGNLKRGQDVWNTSVCANIQASAPPVLKAVGLSLDPPRLSPAVLVEMASGLMGEVGRVSPDPNLASAMRQTAKDLAELPLPVLSGASLLVYTPGLDCDQQKFKGLIGFGGNVKGNATFLGATLANVDNRLALNGNADDRFSMNNTLADFNLGGLIGMKDARIVVNAPLALGPKVAKAALSVTGKVDIGTSKGVQLVVQFSKDKAQFGFDSDLPVLGTLKFNAESQGPSLAQMQDFRLSASVGADSAGQAALVNALRSLLLEAASRNKADPKTKAGYEAIARAQAKLDRASSRLKAAAGRALGACLTTDLDGCISHALGQTLENLDEFKDWILAVAERDSLLLKHYAEKYAYETWDAVEKGLSSAASATAPFSVQSVAVAGGLRSGEVTTSATWSFLGKSATSSFTANFGGQSFGSREQKDTFSSAAAYGPSGPRPAQPQLKGKRTTTTVASSDVRDGTGPAKKVLTVNVAGDVVTCPGKAAERPSGTVYLYMRRPGEARPDPFTADPTKPVQIGTAKLGRGSNCQDGTVKFNANVGTGDNNVACPNNFDGISDFQELRGPVIFSALFQGGPTACSASNEDVNHPDNGFRASLSEDVQITFPGRSDDRGFIASTERPWGSWKPVAECPDGTWAAGFRQRVVPAGSRTDETGLNSVQLVCAKPDGSAQTQVSSHDGYYGDWSQPRLCSPGKWVSQARIRTQNPHGSSDASFRCNDSDEDARKTVLSAGNGLNQGTWSPYGSCPARTAVCGISVKMGDAPRSGRNDSAVNGMRLRCCALP